MKRTALLIALLLIAVGLSAQTFYVRQGATGGGTGSDWSNAYTDLPSTLQRGATYYVASGTYGLEDFKDPETGPAVITIRKATVNDHGPATGWSDSYASGQANFQGFIFETGYYTIDGQTGGGPGSWTSGYGMHVYSGTTGPYLVAIRGTNWYNNPLPQHVTLEHIDFQGHGQSASGPPDGIYGDPNSTTVGFGADNLTIRYCYIHDTALGQKPVRLGWANNVLFEYNYVARNSSSSAQHSEGMMLNGLNNMTIRYNRFEDIEGTAVVAIGSAIAGTSINNNLEMYGNLIYCTPGGGAHVGMGIFGHNKSDGHPELVITNARVVNNTVYNCTTGTWGVYIPNGTGNEVYNNLWVDSYTPTSNITVAGTENSNTSINSFTAGLVGSNDKIYSSGDPFVNQAQGDFQLTGNTDPGTNFSTLFTADMVGNPYTTGTWDRGAFQYAQGSGGGNITLIAPTGLHVVAAP